MTANLKNRCFCKGDPVWRKLCYECQQYFKKKFSKENYNKGFMAGVRSVDKRYQKRLANLERKLIRLENDHKNM